MSDLTGKLGFTGLGDILQFIGSNGGTGELRMMSKFSTEPGFIFFEKGNIVNAQAEGKTGIEAAYALFGWDGEFEFTCKPINIEKVITTNRMEIILDGLRMVDEGEVKKMGPVSFHKTEKDSDRSLPLIKGPLIDYMYVVAEEDFSKNSKIIQENSYGSWIWVILEGIVEVVKDTPKGPLPILRLGSGAFVGSLGSFSFQSNIRNATVVAVTDVQLGVLDSQRLSEEFGHVSAEFKSFLNSLERRRNEVTDQVVEAYMKTNNFRKFVKDKKPAMKQGSKSKALFMIKEGEAAIVRKQKTGFVPLVRLKKGDFFGRLPFLDIGHEPYSSAVFAGEGLEAVRIDPDRMQNEYDQLSPIIRNLIENIGTTISITTRTACDFQKVAAGKKKE